MKRLYEDEIQDSSFESLNKKRKINDNDIIKKFYCSYFYIDKSLIIKEFLEEESKVICVTGPPGCGKTVNLTMMRYFFEMNYENVNKKDNRKIFEKLNIAKEIKDGKSYIDLYQGEYPVIYLDFNIIKIERNFEETIESFKNFIQYLYCNYKIKIEDLNDYDKQMWEKYENCNITDIINLKNSINFLCKCLYKLLNKKIILLIDGYDSLFLNALNTNFYNDFYSFYKHILTNIFLENKSYLFKTFITARVGASCFNNFQMESYSLLDNKYIKYYSITDFELTKLLSQLKLENKREIFERYYILNQNNIRKNKLNEENHEFFNAVFNNDFDYLMIKDMNYLFQNGFIEKSFTVLSDFEMLTEKYISKHRNIIWTLLIEYGYLIIDHKNNKKSNNDILKIRNEVIKEFIEEKFYEWKEQLYKKYRNIIDLFIYQYDEEKIEEFLMDIMKDSSNDFLNRYYTLIYSLLSLNEQYMVIIRNKFNKNNNIRELLFVSKEYLNKLNRSFDTIKDNKNKNKNKNKNDLSNEDSSEIFYITIKNVSKINEIEEGCIQALDDNENFIFNDIELKNRYKRIIKYGIGIFENKCNVIYEINYENDFKRKEMPK
eukprot:jgi/Orpsp1_1/1184808/evm.model.c7180000091040.1